MVMGCLMLLFCAFIRCKTPRISDVLSIRSEIRIVIACTLQLVLLYIIFNALYTFHQEIPIYQFIVSVSWFVLNFGTLKY